MKVTLGIPTYNRAGLWQKGYVMASLTSQTDKDFEVVIVDDNSSDNTVETIEALMRMHCNGFSWRLLKTRREHDKLHPKDSGMADNVIIGEMSGDVLVHLDDDGWFDSELVEYVKKNQSLSRDHVYFGLIDFCEADTLKHVRFDPRMETFRLQQGHKYDIKSEGWHWGSLWAAPAKLLYYMGGHQEETHRFRGCDSRLGYRMAQALHAVYDTNPQFTFHHIGDTWYNSMKQQGRTEEAQKAHKTRMVNEWQPVMIANGGAKYWSSREFDQTYKVIV